MRRFLVGALVLSLGLPAGAFAGKPEKSKGNKSKGQKGDDVRVTIIFNSGEREAVQHFFAEKHGRGNCPPGLAKKHNGCLPPGLAKKRYVVGRALPPDVEVLPLPAELSVRLGRPPGGYRYCMVDGDLVKLAVGTMLVVDAIEGLVE